MKTIDKEVLARYDAGMEKGRLHRNLGLIEFERTKEILLETLPLAPAVICDIGGAYGEYSYWLASLGYSVYLYDLSAGNIRMAREMGEKLGISLACSEVADARDIPLPDGVADAVLLFGPLYHIVDREERMRCLAEAKRLLKPDGQLFTANITCFAGMLKNIAQYDLEPCLDDAEFFGMMAETVRNGFYRKKPIGPAYFHRPDELRYEIASAGFEEIELRGVIGPCWLIRNLDEVWRDPARKETVMKAVRLLEREESLMGLSTHFISISRKK